MRNKCSGIQGNVASPKTVQLISDRSKSPRYMLECGLSSSGKISFTSFLKNEKKKSKCHEYLGDLLCIQAQNFFKEDLKFSWKIAKL